MTLVTTKTVLPGKPGTLKELEKYEDQLVCVRYKYDPEKQRKIKTVEIIVDSKTIKSNNKRIPFNKKVFVKIDYHEKNLRRAVKSVGASWHPRKQLWRMQYGDAYNLGLEDRIVEE
jgi:hypothetical protein